MKKLGLKDAVSREVSLKIGWALGNYQIALKCHDESLRVNSLRTLRSMPDVLFSNGIISRQAKEKVRKYIESKIKEIEGDFKNGNV